MNETMNDAEPVDVMVVGSGFGGAVAALRLAERGVQTVLLERGRRWPLATGHDTFSSLTSPDGRSAWLSSVAVLGDPKPIERYVGVLERVLGNGIAAFVGAGVGGGSLVYAGVLVQPPRLLFDRIFAHRVDYDEMDDVYFERVRGVISPSPCPHHILAHPYYEAARTWLQLGYRTSLPTYLLDLAVDWRVVHEELAGRRVPSVITGEFWYGNDSGAKLSLDRNYLASAEASGCVTILTQQDVRLIRQGPDGRFLVEANEIDDSGSILYEHKYLVRRLFLAAGSIGTSRLLVRARSRGWLPALNDSVGTHWGNNGDFFSALDGASPTVRPNLGGTAPVGIEDSENEVTPTSVECFADWTRDGEQGVVASIGMSVIPPKGTLTYDAITDEVSLNWPEDDPDILRAIEAGTATYERLAQAADTGCRHRGPVLSLAYGMPARRTDLGTAPVDASATAHPLGGVPLGLATDNVGRVAHYPGLYVVDGSLVPGSTGCANPALTIAALAERNMERIIVHDFE